MTQSDTYAAQQAGSRPYQHRGALLWPVALQGVGGAHCESSSSSSNGAVANPSVLPNGVVVAEYLGRVWLLCDDGKCDAYTISAAWI